MAKRNLQAIRLGLVVGSREFFNGAPAIETRRQLIAQLDKLGAGFSILPVYPAMRAAIEWFRANGYAP